MLYSQSVLVALFDVSHLGSGSKTFISSRRPSQHEGVLFCSEGPSSFEGLLHSGILWKIKQSECV